MPTALLFPVKIQGGTLALTPDRASRSAIGLTGGRVMWSGTSENRRSLSDADQAGNEG